MDDTYTSATTPLPHAYRQPTCDESVENGRSAQPVPTGHAMPCKPVPGPARREACQNESPQPKSTIEIKQIPVAERQPLKPLSRVRRGWINFLEKHDLTASEYKLQLAIREAHQDARSFLGHQAERINAKAQPMIESITTKARSALKGRLQHCTHCAHDHLQKAWTKARSVYARYAPSEHHEPTPDPEEPIITSPAPIILSTTNRPRIEHNHLVDHIIQHHSPQTLQTAMFLHQYRQVFLSITPPWSEALKLMIMLEEKNATRPSAVNKFHDFVRKLVAGRCALLPFLSEVGVLFEDQQDLWREVRKFWDGCLPEGLVSSGGKRLGSASSYGIGKLGPGLKVVNV